MADSSESMRNIALQSSKTYLHYDNAYGNQTYQSGGLPWGTSTDKVIWPFDYVVLWDHVGN